MINLLKDKMICFMLCLFCCLSFNSQVEEANYVKENYVFRLTEYGAVIVDWQNWTDEEAQDALEVPSILGGMPVIGIGSCAFETCNHGPYSSYFTLSVPEGVVYLEESAFECCSNASIIYLPSTLEVIPEGCFIHVGAEIIFPNGNPYFSVSDGFLVDHRTDTLLYAAPSSQNFPLPPIRSLGERCLDNWLLERTAVQLPDRITSIGTCVFYDVPDLVQVDLPNLLMHLSSHSFFCDCIMHN